MTITALPVFYDMPYTTEEGKLTTEAHLHNDQTYQVLSTMLTLTNTTVASNVDTNNNVTNQGIIFPSYTNAQIIGMTLSAKIGTVWFNTTISKLQVKTGPITIQTIQSV